MTEQLASRPDRQIPMVRLLTASEVAELLRISRSSVYALDRRGDLACIRILAGPERAQRRWREEDVRAYVQRNDT